MPNPKLIGHTCPGKGCAPETPELDRQLEIVHNGKAEQVQDFLDWLRYDQEVWLCKLDRDEFHPWVVSTGEDILARFFGIDRDKIEQERRAILEHIREHNELGDNHHG